MKPYGRKRGICGCCPLPDRKMKKRLNRHARSRLRAEVSQELLDMDAEADLYNSDYWY